MNRRNFVTSSGLAVAAGGLASSPARAADAPEVLGKRHDFQLKYAPHAGHFHAAAGHDPADEIRYAGDLGFRAWEDNGMPGRSVEQQEKMAKALADKDMEMGVFVATGDFGKPTFASEDGGVRESVLGDIRRAVEVAKRVNATWMTVVPGRVNHRLEPGYQDALAVELLKRCAEVLEPHGLVMVLEPLNFLDHPDLLLTKASHAYDICKAVDSPSCKILYDIYHQQITEGNLIWNIDRAWDEIAYFQCGDVPGRREPGTGEINYRNVFRHIHAKNPGLIMGMEHGVSKGGEEGVAALVRSYVEADAF